MEKLPSAGHAAPPGTETFGGYGDKSMAQNANQVTFYRRSQEIKEKLRKCKATLQKHDWQFPQTMQEAPTEAFQQLFHSVTWLSVSPPAEIKLQLNIFSGDWENLANFLFSMREAPTRRSFIGRIQFVVDKLIVMSPDFAALLDEEEDQVTAVAPSDAATGIQPTPSPASSAVPQSSTSAQTQDQLIADEELATRLQEGEKRLADEAKRLEEDDHKLAALIDVKSAAIAAGLPGVVWIDYESKAYLECQTLKARSDIRLQGFCDNEASSDFTPQDIWMNYIFELAETPARVSVVIANKKHMLAMQTIRDFHMSARTPPPLFVIVTRETSTSFLRDVDIGEVRSTRDWGQAAQITIDEFKRRQASPSAVAPESASASDDEPKKKGKRHKLRKLFKLHRRKTDKEDAKA